MLNKINEILAIVSATLLALASLFIWRNHHKAKHAWTGVGFTMGIFCYLINDSRLTDEYLLPHFLISTGAIVVPVFFWLLSKAIFDDHFQPIIRTFAWFLILLVPRYFQLYLINFSRNDALQSYLHLISEIIAIGFILAGVYEALKNRQADLIDERVRFRNFFTVTTAVLIGLTLIVEIATYGHEAPAILLTLQRASILILTVLFFFRNFEIQPGFFFKEQPKPKTVIQHDPILHKKLSELLQEEKIYRKEGLTIGELSERLTEQEYKVRRMINGQLGFKNFNDFLNQYRIKEACEILSDPAQNRKTVLEIAYDLGYQSIGPFNKAFKEQKGKTPTVFRKNQQSS